MDNIEFRQSFFDTQQELEALVRLQNKVYEGKRNFSIDGFKYWYVDNPVGRVISFNAFAGNEMVAHYACIPSMMEIDGRIVKGIHSMATVTHPDYRGKGLFTTLAKKTYDYAKEQDYEFVVGVANANSIHGFMKYFPFENVGKLDVKVGIGTRMLFTDMNKPFKKYWTKETLEWRACCRSFDYSRNRNTLFGKIKIPFFKTLMGGFDVNLLNTLSFSKRKNIFHPFNLYVGLGANTKKELYINVPGIIKHSPFHLIFLDLSGGKLPKMTKDNVFFQLIDFDVA